MPRTRLRDPRWEIRVAAHDGVFRRDELRRLGVSDALVSHHVAAGRWSLPAPGIVLAAPGPPTVRQWERIALCHAGATAALDDTSALRRYALRYVPEDDRVRVVVRAPWNRRPPAQVVVRRSTRPFTVVRGLGLPVLPLVDAVVATCRRQTSLRAVRALVCEVVQRERLTPGELLAAYEAAPGQGSALLGRALDDVRAGCRSAPEAEVRALFRGCRAIPEPLWNARLGLADGSFLACVDGFWRAEGVVHEVDSWAFHAIGAAWEQTQRRRSRLAALGLIVLSNSPRRVREEGAAVCAEVLAALELGRRRGPVPGVVVLP